MYIFQNNPMVFVRNADELLGLAREITGNLCKLLYHNIVFLKKHKRHTQITTTGVNEGDYAVVVDCRNQADEITIRHIPCIPESRNSNKI